MNIVHVAHGRPQGAADIAARAVALASHVLPSPVSGKQERA